MDQTLPLHAAFLAALRRAAPLVVALAAFAFRFLTLGAIDNDSFLSIALAHQVVGGDWPVRHFMDPGMPLGYLLPAGAAAVAGPTLLTQAVLSLALFSVAVALAFALARRASGSTALALAAVGLVVLFPPRLYNSSKVLVHVAAIAIAWMYADRPSATRLLALAAWTAAAFLFRHDYGVYIGGAALVLIAVQYARSGRMMARHLALYVATAIVLVIPWLLYVEWAAGLGNYIASAVRFSASEGRRTIGRWPLVYYCMASVPVVALVAGRRAAEGVGPAHVTFAGTLLLLLDVGLLRDVAAARVPDVLAPTAIVVAALVGRFVPVRAVHACGIAATLALVIATTLLLSQRGHGIPGFADVARRWEQVAARLSRADPAITPTPAHAPLLAFIQRCTAPQDRVLVIGFAPEIPVLAKRLFAAGHPGLRPGYYEDDADVRVARARLERDRVGVVVVLAGRTALETSWPAIASDLQARQFQPFLLHTGGGAIELWLKRNGAEMKDPSTGLPCGTAR